MGDIGNIWILYPVDRLDMVLFGEKNKTKQHSLVTLSVSTSKEEQKDGDAPGGSLCEGALFKNVNYGNRSHKVFGSLQYLLQVTLQLNKAAVPTGA